jgi:hypothetical protein
MARKPSFSPAEAINTDVSSRAVTEYPGGRRTNYVDIRAQDGILLVDAVGDPSISEARHALTEGLQQGWVLLHMPSLVDLRHYTGRINWADMRDIATMASWGSGSGKPSRVAYLTRDNWFGMILKLMGSIFPRASHRAFQDRENALEWLREADRQ